MTNRFFSPSEPADLSTGSVALYWHKASYGKLTLDGTPFYNSNVCDADGWMTSSFLRSQCDEFSDPNTPMDVVEDALQQVDPYVDFRDYDTDGDGFVDGLYVVFAGPASYGTWMWGMHMTDELGFFADGVGMRSSVWDSEEAYYFSFCHEFGHELGLPDLYDVGGSQTGPSTPGIGYWGLMGTFTAAQGRLPSLPCAFSRTHLRFADAVDVVGGGGPVTVTLNPATADGPAGTLYRVWRNGLQGKEYFLIEFRRQEGFDQALPAAGMLIWHVDESRADTKMHDDSYLPQRVWLECAGAVSDPTKATNTWYQGFNGDDAKDYFDDTTTPNAHDNSGAATGITIRPMSTAPGATMQVEITIAPVGSVPQVSWVQPAADATVSGTTHVEVASNAASRVEYYVNGCLKNVESGPAPYTGFDWNTPSCLDGEAVLRVVACNSNAETGKASVERRVTVANGLMTGLSPPFSESFNAYSGVTDPVLAGLWNVHDDQAGLYFQLAQVVSGSGSSIALGQSSYPAAPTDFTVPDPKAGVYACQDGDWLMTPRLDLCGYRGIALSYKVAMYNRIWGDSLLAVQASTDEGQTWQDVDSLSSLHDQVQQAQYYTGTWNQTPGDKWAQRGASLPSLANSSAFIRFLFVGGWGNNTRIALDDISVSASGTSPYIAGPYPLHSVAGLTVAVQGRFFGASTGQVLIDGVPLPSGDLTTWGQSQVQFLVPSNVGNHTLQLKRADSVAGNLVAIVVDPALTVALSGLDPQKVYTPAMPPMFTVQTASDTERVDLLVDGVVVDTSVQYPFSDLAIPIAQLKNGVHQAELAAYRGVEVAHSAPGSFAAFTLPGDVDASGVVDAADVAALRAVIGLKQGDAGYRAWYDADGDGVVTEADASSIGYHFGDSIPGN